MPMALVPFPSRGPLRSRRQHHRHPADDLRHHAARGRRAAARRRSAGARRSGGLCGCGDRRPAAASPTRSHRAAARSRLLPSMPGWAFGAMVAGGLWLCLWTSAAAAARARARRGRRGRRGASPAPDLLVTGDGMHLAVVDRRHAAASCASAPAIMSAACSPKRRASTAIPSCSGRVRYSACSRDACVAVLRKGPAEWRLLATRSATRIDWATITSACAEADIVVSDRRLPRGCIPRWLKLDRDGARTNGRAGDLSRRRPRIDTVADRVGAHPWAEAAR